MKAETIYLTSQDKVQDVVDTILNLEVGNKYKVEISDAGCKTSRQNRYQRRLCRDVAKSGIGGRNEVTPEKVHIKCKYLFALPVILEKDENFAWLYEMVRKEVDNDKDKLMWFVDKHVSTMDFTVSEGANYIQDMIDYYAPMGANLTDPKEYNL